MRHLFFFLIAPQIYRNLHLYLVIHWASGKSQGSLLTFIKSDILPFIFSLQHRILKKHFKVCCRLVKLYIAVLFTVKWSKAAKEKSTRTDLVYKEWEKKKNIAVKAAGFKQRPSNSIVTEAMREKNPQPMNNKTNKKKKTLPLFCKA